MNDGAGIVTPVASSNDDDGNTDKVSRILSLVLWSSSLLRLQTIAAQTTTSNKVLRPLVKRKTRQPKKNIFFLTGLPFLTVMPQQRHEFAMNPRRSMWYHIYIMHPQVDNPRFHALFRRRFRLPYGSFLSLNSELEVCPKFSRWHTGNRDMIGSPSSPISILILSALCYLGRSWTLDDLQEAKCISEEVIRVFLHRFLLDYGSTVLYERWVSHLPNYVLW
jgi:hypothetical protein